MKALDRQRHNKDYRLPGAEYLQKAARTMGHNPIDLRYWRL